MSANRLRCLFKNAQALRLLVPNQATRVIGGVAWCSTSESSNTNPTEANKTSERTERLVNRDVYPDIDPATSLEYMKSEAYSTSYGDLPVWKNYRRNFKGQWAPETRTTCIRGGKLATGNPCPICRDEYLVINHQNVKLLNQFISPYTGEILPTKKTGICQKQMRNLKIAVAMAEDNGLIEKKVPFRKYDYSEYLDTVGT